MRAANTITILIVLLASATANASTTYLDANYTPTTPGGSGLIVSNDISASQTFTVVNTGELSSIALDLYTYDGNPGLPLTVDIVTTSGGLPSEATSGPSVLASATLSASAVTSTPAFVPVSISGFAVTSGEVLAIVLSTASAIGYVWDGDLDWPHFGENEGTYSGGLAYDQGPDATTPNGSSYTLGSSTWVPIFLYNSPGVTSGPQADFGFETFVTVAAPEPSTI